jgi:hypothetical protein
MNGGDIDIFEDSVSRDRLLVYASIYFSFADVLYVVCLHCLLKFMYYYTHNVIAFYYTEHEIETFVHSVLYTYVLHQCTQITGRMK